MSKAEEKKDVEMGEGSAEPEEDARKDSRQKISTDVAINDFDTTLDVLVAAEGSIVTGLTADGWQYLLSGARANVGLKSGRYVYEAKIIEAHNPAEQPGRGSAPRPKNLLRIGFSTIKSSLLMGVDNEEESICLDNTGCYFVAGKRVPLSKQQIAKHDCIAIVLNLDKKSKNANTVSFFKNGVRTCPPVALPEHLQGKALFPTMTFRNISVAVNYSGDLWKSLPFECISISDAAEADVEMSPVKRPGDGKYEVVCPVGMPEEGFFDYCDQFTKVNPGYFEISDRSIMAWAEKSGVRRMGSTGGPQDSLDKPIFAFGLPGLEDGSVQKMMKILASTAKRNVLVAQLKENLTLTDRAELLKCFKGSSFKKVAHVVMGDPPKAFKDYCQSLMKADKEKAAEAKKKAEENKKNSERIQKLNALKKKQTEAVRKHTIEKARRKADKEKKKAQKAREKEAKMKKKEADKKKRAEENAKKVAEGAEPPEPEPEEEEEEDKEEEEEELPEPKPTPEEEKEMEELSKPIEVELDTESLELTEEEKKLCFRKLAIPEMSSNALAASFAKFSIPANKEGWSDIKFMWSNRTACEKKLKDWCREKKSTGRVDDIVPSEWFKEKQEEWTKQREDLKKKLKEFQGKNIALSKKEEEPDVHSCQDINDANGNGEPLFAKFEMEDWALLNLRFEIHLLIHAFRRDVNDEERPGIHVEHFDFYYQKYYKRAFTLAYFGCKEFQEMLDLIKGTASIDEERKVLNSDLSGEDGMEELVKATEEARRERLKRIDAGDETARLHFKVPAGNTAKRASPPTSGPPGKRQNQWKPYVG